MKIGQLVSLQGEDVLPPEFAQALAVLRSQATPMPPQQVRGVLGREYGKGWERRFSAFDCEPVAAASIGQVHRATTPDGRDLALKIQYPGVARSIASDVDNVAVLLRLFNLLPLELDVAGMAAEAKRQLAQEADYVSEARFLERYARLVADEPALLVPRVHWDLTTPRVMAMDFVEGEPLDVLDARAAGPARCRRHPARAPAVPRAVRVPRHADRSQLRELPVPARERARGAARFRRDAALRRGLRRELRAHHPWP